MINIITGISTSYKSLKSALININGKIGTGINVERRGFYGLSSKPLPQTITTVIKNGQKAIVLFEENPNVKIELKDGEVALHDGLNTVHLKRQGGIEIISAGNISIGGKGAQKLITEAFLKIYAAHTHPAPGGATSAPTPVPLEATLTKILEGL